MKRCERCKYFNGWNNLCERGNLYPRYGGCILASYKYDERGKQINQIDKVLNMIKKEKIKKQLILEPSKKPSKQIAETVFLEKKSIKIKPKIWKDAKIKAIKEGTTVSNLVEKAIRKKLNKEDDYQDDFRYCNQCGCSHYPGCHMKSKVRS